MNSIKAIIIHYTIQYPTFLTIYIYIYISFIYNNVKDILQKL